ncbi:MAG: MbnP family protein [Bacteroidota bacterium]
MKKIIFICCFFSVLIMSCSKDPDTVNKKTVNELDTITNYTGLLFATDGKVSLNFSHYFNVQPIVYGSQNYINNAKDTLTISNLSYRISNIQLKDKLKNTWTNIGTYNLNQGDDAFKYIVSISKVPAGLYDSIRFDLGVDSVANSTGEQTGALDPSLGMYWNWTSGYIFYRLEGRTTDLVTFSLDVGGNKNLVNKAFDLSSFKVKNATNGVDVEIKMDLGKFFNTPNTYDLKVDKRNIHNANEPSLAKLLPNMNAMFILQDVKLK